VLQWLLDKQYAIMVGKHLVLTSTLYKDLELITKLPEAPVIRKLSRGEELRELWRTFVTEADIPSIAITQTGGSYFLRPYSESGALELKKVLSTAGVSRQRLIESTKFYYRTVSFKKTLLNYLRDGVWEEAYNNYLANPFYDPGDNPMEI